MFDSLLDQARSGPLYLRQPEIARGVADAFGYGEERMRRYDLHSWVIMPNHVPVLITPWVEPSKITQSLKRFTARAANLVLGLPGRPFWEDESYDRLVRNKSEFDRIVSYIEMNPVRAGLAAGPGAYPWSSAYLADCKSAAG